MGMGLLLIAAAVFLVLIVFTVTATKRLVVVTLSTIALVALVWVPAGRVLTDSPYAALNRLVPILVLGLGVLALIRTGLPSGFGKIALRVGALGFIAAVATSRIVDQGEWRTLLLTYSTLTGALLLGAAIAAADATAPMARALVWAGLVEAALAVVELFTFSQPLWRGGVQDYRSNALVAAPSDILPGYVRSQGTMSHSLPLAFLLLCALTIVVRQAPSKTRLAAIAVLLAGILATGSRNALGVAVIILIIRGGQRLRARVVPLLGLTAVAILLFGVGLPWLSRFTESGSVTHRTGAFTSIERLFFDRGFSRAWIGDGAAALPRVFSERLLQSDGFLVVDNQAVLTTVETGILGLILLTLICWGALRSKATSGTLQALIVVVIAQFAIFDVLSWAFAGAIFAALMGIAYCQAPAEDTRDAALSAGSDVPESHTSLSR